MFPTECAPGRRSFLRSAVLFSTAALPESYKKKCGAAMELGDVARKTIKGHDLPYLNLLAEVREQTPVEFRKRDDNWLVTVDKTRSWGPTNNESNHNGQIKFLAKRLPGAKPSNE